MGEFSVPTLIYGSQRKQRPVWAERRWTAFERSIKSTHATRAELLNLFKQARHPVGRSRAIFTAFDVSNSVYKVNAAKEWLTSPTQVDSLMSSAGIAKKNPDSDIPGAFSGS